MNCNTIKRLFDATNTARIKFADAKNDKEYQSAIDITKRQN